MRGCFKKYELLEVFCVVYLDNKKKTQPDGRGAEMVEVGIER